MRLTKLVSQLGGPDRTDATDALIDFVFDFDYGERTRDFLPDTLHGLGVDEQNLQVVWAAEQTIEGWKNSSFFIAFVTEYAKRNQNKKILITSRGRAVSQVFVDWDNDRLDELPAFFDTFINLGFSTIKTNSYFLGDDGDLSPKWSRI